MNLEMEVMLRKEGASDDKQKAYLTTRTVSEDYGVGMQQNHDFLSSSVIKSCFLNAYRRTNNDIKH
jgi:hypothetical protein